jgi:hypothetical protein
MDKMLCSSDNNSNRLILSSSVNCGRENKFATSTSVKMLSRFVLDKEAKGSCSDMVIFYQSCCFIGYQ